MRLHKKTPPNIIISGLAARIIIIESSYFSYYEKIADETEKCIDNEVLFAIPSNWSWERLGNLSSIARGGSPRPIEDYLTTSPNGLNWIKIGDTRKDDKYISSAHERIIPEGLSKTRFVHKGDFLLTNSMSFGRPYILEIDGCIHDGWLVIGNTETVFYQDYLYYMLSSNIMFKSLSLLAAGSTVKNLKTDSVKSVLVPLPPILEQKAISEAIEQYFNILNSLKKSLE